MLTRREGDASSAYELASLVTSEPAPTPPPSPSGAHTQEAAGCRPALAATLTSTLLARPPPSLPPSPRPAAASTQRSRGSPERGAHGHQRSPSPRRPKSSRLSPALHRFTDGTRRKQLASLPGCSPQTHPPAYGEDEQDKRGTKSKLNFLKHYLHVCVCVCGERMS